MKIALGAPVANRAWILPRFFEYLRQQTLQPDALCWVFSPTGDSTYCLLHEMANEIPTVVCEYQAPFYPRSVRNDDPDDRCRARHFSALRNTLRDLFLRTDADVYVSCDTDILLEDPTALERLVDTLDDGWDVACARTCLHVLGERSGAYNAGFWTYPNEPWSEQRAWVRASREDLPLYTPSLVHIDVPMACYAMKAKVLADCRYKTHECGEDLGFAQSLFSHQYRVAWCTDIPVRHVWGPEYLEEDYGPDEPHISRGVHTAW